MTSFDTQSPDTFLIQARNMSFKDVLNACQSNKRLYERVCTANFWESYWSQKPQSREERSVQLEKMLMATEDDKFNWSLFNGILRAGCNLTYETLSITIGNNHDRALVILLQQGCVIPDDLSHEDFFRLRVKQLVLMAPFMTKKQFFRHYKDTISSMNGEELHNYTKELLEEYPEVKKYNEKYNEIDYNLLSITIKRFLQCIRNVNGVENKKEVIRYLYDFLILVKDELRKYPDLVSVALDKLRELADTDGLTEAEYEHYYKALSE